MTAQPEAESSFDALWGKVIALLDASEPLEARATLLHAWRRQRHARLAELIDACDVRLRRLGRVPQEDRRVARSSPGQTFVFTHPWREWFTRDADEVTNRLAIYEDYPDPAATRVALELMHVAPLQLLIAERLWSVVARVLVALGDVRALPSLARFVDGRWPPRRPHLAIQSVPHLESALEKLRARPAEPPLEVPAVLLARLGPELDAVEVTSEVSPFDPIEAKTQFERFATQADEPARSLLADWLIEAGDPRGVLLNLDRQADASPAAECLRIRVIERWLSTASHPVLTVALRAGLPWAVTIGHDSQRSRTALADPWPFWPLIGSLTVDEWDDSLRAVIDRLGRMRELRRVPWSAVQKLTIDELEILESDPDGLRTEDLAARCPRLQQFVGTCRGPLSAFDGLRELSRVVLEMPPTTELILEFAASAVQERRVRTAVLDHRLIGRPAQLQVETTVANDWFLSGADEPEELVFHELEELRARLAAIADWRLTPGQEQKVPGLREWMEERGLTPS